MAEKVQYDQGTLVGSNLSRMFARHGSGCWKHRFDPFDDIAGFSTLVEFFNLLERTILIQLPTSRPVDGAPNRAEHGTPIVHVASVESKENDWNPRLPVGQALDSIFVKSGQRVSFLQK